MKEIPNQCLKQLNPTSIELNTSVNKVESNALWINNKKHTFKHIVIATDISTCHALLNKPLQKMPWNGISNYIFEKKTSTTLSPLTLIGKESCISHFNIPTLVSPNLAPKNSHYMTVSSFQSINPTSIEQELHQLTNENDWQFRWSDTIHQGLPNIYPQPKLDDENITLCGDWTTFASIEGAMKSGYAFKNKAMQLNH